ncbi:MAG: 3-dehydroquinate synthase [Patescibacteria group bacterium]|nr:MAG: 3-dehydroquinate synthase [Patescibacteria group bacterium]
MKTISINLKAKKYPVFIGKNILRPALQTIISELKPDKTLCLIDQNLQIKSLGLDKTIKLAITEQDKNIKTTLKLIDSFLKLNLGKKSLVVNIGGGAFTDTAGFAESIYARGIRFINCPTTLLAMVDASIGGKTGVNYKNIKNIIGSIQQPNAVIIDTSFLTTLPKDQLSSGYAEIIKHSLIKDKNYFNHLKLKDRTLEQVIFRSIQIKKEIIELDEDETNGLRQLLNFGHTIGHSLESFSHKIKKPLLHGYAVSLGIIAETYISVKLGYLNSESLDEIITVLADYNLPTKLEFKPDYDFIQKAIAKDKKSVGGKPKLVLLKEIGKAVTEQTTTFDIINDAVKFLCKKQ